MSNSVAMSDTIDLFGKELLLCGVKEGTTIAVLSEVDRLADYAAGFLAAPRHWELTLSTLICCPLG